jgi:Mrp family chromosome partitioning ATPase
MEKLQLALEKARQKRQDPAPVASAPVDRPVARGREERQGFRETAPLWHALTAVELDPRLMTKNRVFAPGGGEAATEFDLLRTKALLQMRKNGWRRLAITSPTMGCGKTTTAANLALGFTRQLDKSVILFELDLRRPSLSGMLGVRPEFGVRDLLQGSVDFAHQALRVGDNVALSLSYASSKDSSQLLLRDATARQIDAIESAYQPDLMIFDLPPMLASDDTTAFLKNVDCVLLIAGAEITTTSQVDTCEREIAEHTNVLGVVLNKCRFHEEESGLPYGGY